MSAPRLAVVLCGGSGTRLWPASTPRHPKPLLRWPGHDLTLFQRALRTADAVGNSPPLVVGAQAHAEALVHQAQEISTQPHLLLERAPSGTTAAVASAVRWGLDHNLPPETVLVILSADQIIDPPHRFDEVLRQAAEVAATPDGKLVLVGVAPRGPRTEFGWIEPGPPNDNSVARPVRTFHEKPDQACAQRYLDQGWRWNAGVFVARLDTLSHVLPRLVPATWQAARPQPDLSTDPASWHVGPQPDPTEDPSFDRAVVQRHDSVWMVPLDAPWFDVGTWEGVAEAFGADRQGNTLLGSVQAADCEDVVAVHTGGPAVQLRGLRSLVAVAGEAGVMVRARADGEPPPRRYRLTPGDTLAVSGDSAWVVVRGEGRLCGGPEGSRPVTPGFALGADDAKGREIAPSGGGDLVVVQVPVQASPKTSGD